MTHAVLDQSTPVELSAVVGFLVLRQDPDTREYAVVGRLDREGDEYVFRYAPRVSEGPNASPLPGLPDRRQTYRSRALFATFSNRVMTPRRDSYQDYLGLLGLQGGEPEPFEVLARTWGTRTTDRIQVLPIPRVGPGGHLQTRFLVHGGAHVDPDGRALRRVRVGDQLQLRREPENPVDTSAVLVLRMGEEDRLGYIPRPLAPFIHALWAANVEPVVIAEHINLPGARLVSNQMRLLARLEARAPDGFDVEAALGQDVGL
ncbi:MAG: HIRAN domain-containing protein [Propionicimonas sp.]